MSGEIPVAPRASGNPKAACGLTCGILGCIGVAGLAGLSVAIALAVLFFQGRKTFSPYVDEFFDAMNAENYEAVYGMLSSEWQTTQDKEETLTYLRSVRDGLGRCTSRSIVSVAVTTDELETSASVVVKARFERGPGAVELKFLKDNGGWRIGTVIYDSPALAPVIDGVQGARTEAPAAILGAIEL